MRESETQAKTKMASLRTAMDAAFWDLNIASPQTLVDGAAKFVPGEPFPVDGARGSRVLRVQQLHFLGNGFPLGIIPSYSPTRDKALGSFSLHSLVASPSTSNWWLGLIGQFRPKKLFSALKAELSGIDELELPAFKDVAKHFFDKSLYSLGICSQLSLTNSSSLLLSTEGHGERKGRRTKAMLFHKLPDHDITLEAAWPELFIDHNGGYWNVPESISLDMASLISKSGLRYHFGIHKNGGLPEAANATNGKIPPALMPGLCAKGAFSYEKSRDIWRQKQTEDDALEKTEGGWFSQPSYDTRLSEPFAAVSGVIGGTCAAWYGGEEPSVAVESGGNGAGISANNKKTSFLNADLFGSLCYTFQHGNFRELYGDLTRIDARLDICSASAFSKGVINIFRRSSANSKENLLASPRLNLVFQQQVAGPIVFRVDSKIKVGSPKIEDFVCSLSYAIRSLESGKVVAWYSPKRKEGMIELRLFEF